MTIYVDIKSCVGNFQIHFSQARSALFRGTGLSCRFDKKTLRCCSFSTAVVFAEVIRKELLVKSHMVDVKSLSVGFSVGSEPDLDVADFFRFLWILCCGCCEVTCTAKFRHSTRAKTQWLSKTCWFVRCLFKTSCSLVCVKGPKIENRWRKHWCTIYNTYVRNVKIWDPCLCFFLQNQLSSRCKDAASAGVLVSSYLFFPFQPRTFLLVAAMAGGFSSFLQAKPWCLSLSS